MKSVYTKMATYYKITGNCDAYIECKDYHRVEHICPDGLHFDAKVIWPSYPCGYPADVTCDEDSIIQDPQPTAECPHRHGFYLYGSLEDGQCDKYKVCVDGGSTVFFCPFGLAFNAAVGRCDWPDLVPSCNADAYLGFKCPEVPLDTPDSAKTYKYDKSCYYFFSCANGRARILSCDEGFAFEPHSGRCIDANTVNCVEEGE